MYGGLGKMVDIFIRHADRPIAVCAPMYSGFYEPGGHLDKLQPILSFNVDAGPAKHQVRLLGNQHALAWVIAASALSRYAVHVP